jgi:hypothetical protein
VFSLLEADMSQRVAFVISTVVAAIALIAATVTAPVDTGITGGWRAEDVANAGSRQGYALAYVALRGRDRRTGRDTLARMEVLCHTDSGARMLVGLLPDRPPSDTARGQAPYFTTVHARIESMRPFLRLLPPIARLEGDWPFRQIRNGGWVVARTGAPVRRLAAAMRDDRRMFVDFANGRSYVFPLAGADTATSRVLSKCIDPP